MAVALKDLIDLPLLTYYDDKIKKWVISKISTSSGGGGGGTVFTEKGSLPEKGEVGVLYVTETSIAKWDGTKYVEVGNPEEVSNATTWNQL